MDSQTLLQNLPSCKNPSEKNQFEPNLLNYGYQISHEHTRIDLNKLNRTLSTRINKAAQIKKLMLEELLLLAYDENLSLLINSLRIMLPSIKLPETFFSAAGLARFHVLLSCSLAIR